MAITFKDGGSVTLPAALNHKAYDAANKTGELKDILENLATLHTLYTTAGGKIPNTAQKATIAYAENWGGLAATFLNVV